MRKTNNSQSLPQAFSGISTIILHLLSTKESTMETNLNEVGIGPIGIGDKITGVPLLRSVPHRLPSTQTK